MRNHPRNGRRVARLFRQARQLSESERICDLDEIRAQDCIELVVSQHAEPGYAACLVCPGEGAPCGIMLAPGQNRGRARFSVAHELGHYHIPTHANRRDGWCGETDMALGASAEKVYEWEANDFAAELLMPQHLFSGDAADCDPSFRDMATLACPERYDVSITAATLRFVELTRECCALVCSRDGTIEWVSRSKPFVYRTPWRGDRIPVGSVAHAVRSGEDSGGELEPVEPHEWLEMHQRQPVEVFESVLDIPSTNQLLSLLWVHVDDG